MAKAKSKTKDPNRGLKDQISKKLRELEELSPRQIKDHIGLWRRGFNQNDGLLANWLKGELDLEQVTVKGISNLNDNLEVVVYVATGRVVMPFHVAPASRTSWAAARTRPTLCPGCR